MVALTTAFFTAALALIGNIVLSFWRLDQDRRGVAAALAGEIGAYMRLLDPPTFAVDLRQMAASDRARRQRVLRSLPATQLGHPVFDKVADKIGLLPVAAAEDVSDIYNTIIGTLAIMSHLSTNAFIDADDEIQGIQLRGLADRIERETRDARDLLERLTLISRRGWRERLRDAWRGS
jgi:hypothetical protein